MIQNINQYDPIFYSYNAIFHRYNAIYIEDFVNLAFIALILKRPQILTQFISTQFKELPKNKRQLKLINFIIKTVQVIMKSREEVYGLKLKLKGTLIAIILQILLMII